MVRLSVVIEWALLCTLAVLAFVPSRAMINFFGVDLPLFVVLMGGIAALLLPVGTGVDRPFAKRPFRMFVLVLGYALITVVLQQHGGNSMLIYVIPLISAFLAILVPYRATGLIESLRSHPQTGIFVFSAIITFSMTVFAIWRPSYAYGGRVASPLGGSADVHVTLLLTLGAYFACARSGYRRFLSLALALLTIVLIILTASRAGFAGVVILCVLTAFDARRPGRSILVGATLTGVLFTLLKLIPTARLGDRVDLTRAENLHTSMHILDAASPTGLVFGTGSGQVWNWYAYEGGFTRLSDTTMVWTPFGGVLANPHSVVLGTLVELGIIGFGLTLLTLVSIFRRLRAVRFDRDGAFTQGLLLGILSTLPSFFLNYYLFKGFPGAFIWWFFAFFALTLSGDPNRRRDRTNDEARDAGESAALPRSQQRMATWET